MELIISVPKFGTTIWFLLNNKAVSGVLIGCFGSFDVNVNQEREYFNTKYQVNVNKEYWPLLDDSQLQVISSDAAFLSKQELLNSL